MEYERQARACVEQLGIANGIRGLRLDADGSTGLKLKDGRELFLRYMRNSRRLCVFSVLAPVPTSPDPKWLLTLLKKNCLEADTDGGVLSVSESLMAFIYHVSLPVSGIDAGRLEREIDGFLARQQRIAQSCWQQ